MSMPSGMGSLGLGLGWRPELAPLIASEPRLFAEVIAEEVTVRHLPRELEQLVREGRPVIPHGIRLSLGGADPPERRRLDHLAAVAERVNAPLVSEHIAFARAHGTEAGHVLPVPRTSEALEIIAENVAAAQARLPVPLALEHVAALVEWPDPTDERSRVHRRAASPHRGAAVARPGQPLRQRPQPQLRPDHSVEQLPLERIAYVHVGGGVSRNGRYYDTHADPIVPDVLELVTELCARVEPPGILLERDRAFPGQPKAAAELEAIANAAARGASRRAHSAS